MPLLPQLLGCLAQWRFNGLWPMAFGLPERRVASGTQKATSGVERLYTLLVVHTGHKKINIGQRLLAP